MPPQEGFTEAIDRFRLYADVLSGGVLAASALGLFLLAYFNRTAQAKVTGLLLSVAAAALLQRLLLYSRLPLWIRCSLSCLIGLTGMGGSLLIGGVESLPLVVFLVPGVVLTCPTRTRRPLMAGMFLALGIGVAGGGWPPPASAWAAFFLTVLAFSFALALSFTAADAENRLKKQLAGMLADFHAVQNDREQRLAQLTAINISLEERYAESYALNLIDRELSAVYRDEKAILAKVADILLGLLGGKSCSILLYDRETGELREAVATGAAVSAAEIGYLNRCWPQEEQSNHPEQAEDEREFCRARGINGLIRIPIMAKDKKMGIILVEYDALPQSLEDHRRLLESVANRFSLAMENAALYREVHYMATHDALTGLWNRHYLEDRLQAELGSAGPERPLSAIMIDIDYFKKINDAYGHEAGDALLIFLGRAIPDIVGVAGVAARYGGEEFVVLLPGTGLAEAARKAEELRTGIGTSAFGWGDREIRVTISLGVATYPEHARNNRSLLDLADQGLYLAKRAGRNRVAVASLETE